MKKQVILFLLLVIIIILIGINYQAKAQSSYKNPINNYQNNYVPNEIIIKYKNNVIGNGNEIFVKERNEILVYEYIEKPNEIERIVPNTEIYNLRFGNDDITKIIENYNKLPEVEYAEPNFLFKSFIVPSDENYSLKYELRNINAEEAWNLTIGNKEIKIAIIDTGVDWDHPDLAFNIWNNSNELCDSKIDLDNNSYKGDCRGYDFTDINISSYINQGYVLDENEDYNITDNNPMDFHGHGSHAAGIAGAVGNNNGLLGICWNCSIMPVRAGFGIKSSNVLIGSLETDDVAAALYYASNNNATIISMSFGGSNSKTLRNAINYAYNKSILVASAGNDGKNIKQYPCAYDNVICVASTNSDNTSASYSSYGDWVDIAAPGTSIWSTYANGYASLSGTSMSTPLVAGSIGLITVFNKNQTEIKNAINKTGVPVNFTDILINNIDIYKAILFLDNIKPTVNLFYPSDNYFTTSTNQNFSCNASDWQLKNATLKIWNSTSLYYKESKNISGIFNETTFNVTLDYNNFKWNCFYYDKENNYGNASNFSIFVSDIAINLISPLNNTIKNTKETFFNCSIESKNLNLTNITLNLFKENLVYNITQNISENSSFYNFNYNFSEDGYYLWNCKAFNNERSFTSYNLSIIYDSLSPIISLLDPENNKVYNINSDVSQEIIFGFNVTDNKVNNCSLVINEQINSSKGVNKSLMQNFSVSFGLGSYNWSVNCNDEAGNIGNSDKRSFNVSLSDSSSGSSSGSESSSASAGGGSGEGTGGSSGGAGITNSVITETIKKTYFISKEQLSKGYIKELAKNDEIKFTFSDEKVFKHSLKVDGIGDDFVELTIQSNPIKLKLLIGQEIKLNLTGNYYDLFVKLNSIKDNKSELLIKTINEAIENKVSEGGKSGITGLSIEETNETEFNNFKGKIRSYLTGNLIKNLDKIKEYKNIGNIIVLIIIIALIIILIKKNKYVKENKLDEIDEIIKKDKIIKSKIKKLKKFRKKNKHKEK